MPPSMNQIRQAGVRLRDWWGSEVDLDDLGEVEVLALGDAYDLVSEFRATFSQPLLSVRMSVASCAHTCGYGDEAHVAQRLKRLPRIISKLDRIRTMNVTTMGDIGGCRVVLPDLEAVHKVYAHLAKQWNGRIRSVRDYIDSPKDDGYRAIHVETVRGERRIEVQLRSTRQHFWADTVEKVSRRQDVEYKWGEGADDLKDFFRDWGDSLAHIDRGEEVPLEFVERLETFLHEADDEEE